MKNKQTGFVVLALIVGGVEYVAYQNEKVKTSQVSDQMTPSFLPLVTVTDQAAGISVKVPATADQKLNSDGSMTITLGSRYWDSFGFSSTTLHYLNEQNSTGGTVISIGFATSSVDCSIESFNGNKGGSSTSTIVLISGVPFYDVGESDYGMNHGFNTTRYVQLLQDQSCRYVEYSNNYANAGAYGDTPDVQAVENEIKGIQSEFYTLDDFRNSVSLSAGNKPQSSLISSTASQTYTNSQYGFSLQYPNTTTVVSPEGQENPSPVVSNSLIAFYTKSPQLINGYAYGYVGVNVLTDPSDVSKCATKGLKDSTTTINSVQFLVGGSGSAAAGTQEALTSYRTLHGNYCYVIGQDEYSHYQGGTIDASQAKTDLESIVSSFKFTN